MAENFYSILTSAGLAKLANAQVTGKKVDLTEIAVSDGGTYYNPTQNDIQLRNEVWRGNIGSVEIDSENPNWIVIESYIPATQGGFTVREVGIFDDAGDLIAIGKYPETYKPSLDDGATKDLLLRMIIEVTNASAVTMKVDPSVIIASRKYVDEKVGVVSDNLTQLDNKVMSHLAEDATDAHNATNISLIDTSNLFTSTNVEGALKELFTNVSNGKNLVGRAITDVDENITIPTDPTFQQLANAIGQISTGNKWASGQAVISQDKLPFMYVGTGSANLRYIEVYGLDFKASNIVVIANGNARGFSVYTELDDYYNYSPTVKTAPYINGGDNQCGCL